MKSHRFIRFFVAIAILILVVVLVNWGLRLGTNQKLGAGTAQQPEESLDSSPRPVSSRSAMPGGDQTGRDSSAVALPAEAATTGQDAPKPLLRAPSMMPIPVLPEAERPTFRDDAESRPPYEVKRVILTEEKAIDGFSRILRTQLIETDMKYPFLRVEEEIRIEGHAQEEFVISRTASVATHVIVEPQPGKTAEMEAWAKQRNIQPMRRGPTSFIYLMPVSMASLDDLPRAIEEMKKEVATFSVAEPDYIVQPLMTPDDPNFGGLWGMNNTGQSGGKIDADIDAVEAWQLANPTSGTSVVVGVIDTGIDYNHPDLAANIWINTDEIAGNGIDDDGNGYVDDRRGWDFANNDNDPMDDHFHGTHVAGTIGAIGNNAAGVAGVAWNVKLMPLKFLGTYGGTTSDAIEAIDYATSNGCRLTNNSWGGGGWSQSLSNAIQRAESAGVLFVAAAGNSAQNIDANPSYPAAYPQPIILSVASSTHTDALSGFSNYGVKNVDVAAPGSGILSTFPTFMTDAMSIYGLPSGYATISGTSMASPHVAGLAALLWSHQPDMSAETVKSRIMTRGDLIPALTTQVMSSRRINAAATVQMSGGDSPPELLFTTVKSTFIGGNGDESLNPGETIEITPELMNFGETTAQPVTIEVVPQNPGLTVIGNAVMSVPAIEPMTRKSPTSPLRVAVASNLSDNTRVDVQIVARWQNGQEAIYSYKEVVIREYPATELEINWLPGEPVADTTRERVYVMDRTNSRVLAIDTATGSVVAVAGLAGSSEIAPPVENMSLRTGMLTVSHGGGMLWAALPADKVIQGFHLPDLTPAVTLPVDFKPVSLAQAANGRLFATSTDYFGPIREIDPSTGAVIRTFDKHNSKGTYYMHSLLRLDADGTRLFIGQTGLRTVGGPGLIDEFDVSGTSTPPLVASHPYWQFYMKDFEVDSSRQRIYTVNGGFRGIQVTATNPGGEFGFLWPFVWADGASVEVPPGSSSIYGANGDFYEGEISRFDAEDGMRIERRVVGTEGKFLPPRSLAVTPGGVRVYVKSYFTGTSNEGVSGFRYYLGVMGPAPLNMGSFPPPNPIPEKLELSNVEFSESVGNFDGVASPGETVRLRPTYKNWGSVTATGISVTCSTSTVDVTSLAPSSMSIPDISGSRIGSPPDFFQIQIGSDVANETIVDVDLTVTHGDSVTTTHKYSFTVRTAIPNILTTTHGALGELLADRTRDLVYLQDRQNHRILAIDTGLGVAVAACPLVGPAKVGTATTPPALGGMALSTDGSTLYVAIRDAGMIQAISLPDLTTSAAWTFDFNPTSLATDALGRIYAASASSQPRQIDGNTGTVLGSFGSTSHRLLRSSADGTLLFAPSAGQAERFDTAGNGLPVSLGSTDIGMPGMQGTQDLFWDDTRQRFLHATNGENLKVASLTGTLTDWATTSSVNSVTMSPDRSLVWAGVSGVSTGKIRVFNADTGAIVRDISIISGNYYLAAAGLAVTPNGRAVYVMQSWTGTYNSSVDGYNYRIGIIGAGAADLDLPLPVGSFAVKSVTLSDPLPAPNNNDGYVGPGETVRLTPVLKNQSLTTATGVELSLVSASSKAVIATASPVTIGNMPPYTTFTPSSPFQVTIDSSAADGEEILVKFHIRRDGAADEAIEHKLVVFKPDTVSSVALPYQIGEITADPARNFVYLVDKTNSRLLRFDTDSNSIGAAVPLAGSPGAGHMDISADNSRLFVALTGARKLQVFRLPELTQADLVDVNFDIHSIALGSDGNIYASSADNLGDLRRVNPLTGEVLTTFNNGSAIYKGALLRMTADRSRLLMMETGLSGIGVCPEWDILQTPVARVGSHSYNKSNTKEMRVDELYRRIYFGSGGVYGVGVTEMDSGLGGILWPNNAFSAYGRGVTFLPDSRFVFGLSSGTITRFNRATGARVGHYDVATSTADLGDRGIAITPNGRIVFVRKPFTGNHTLGVIGGPAISATLPAIAPSTYAGGNRSLKQDHAVALENIVVNAGSAGTLAHRWCVLDGPADATFSATSAQNTTASFTAPGRYFLEVTSSVGSVQSSDIVVVDVAPAPARVSVTASKESASIYKKTPGEFTFTRQGGEIGQPLVVKFSTGGTAVEGSHFQTLGNHITIPAGQSVVTVPVAISAASLPTSLSVTLTLSADPAYAIGDYREASVALIDGSFSSWQQTFLSGVSPVERELLKDPDGDGRVNLLEYALGTDPSLKDHGPAVAAVMDPINGLCLTYTIPAGSAASYTVETSSSLAPSSWSSGSGFIREISRVTNTDGSITVKAGLDDPAIESETVFIRLKVQL